MGRPTHIAVRVAAVLCAAATMSAVLGGCTSQAGGSAPASKDAIAPKTVGDWTQVTQEQAFDSGIGKIDGANTTSAWIAAGKAQYAQELANEFDGVKFKGGASPTVDELVFYAPSSESKANAPKHLGVLVISKLPGTVVAGADASRFRKFAGEMLHVQSDGKALVYSAGRGERALALVSPYAIDVSATDPSFVKAYVAVATPLTEP